MLRAISVLCISLFVAPFLNGEDRVPDSMWELTVHIQRSSKYQTIESPPATTIENLTDKVITSMVDDLPEYLKCSEQGNWQVDTVGLWYEKTVIDLFFQVQCRQLGDTTEVFLLNVVKAIAIENTLGQYRLLYLSSTEPGDIYFVPSKIVRVRKNEFLITRSQRTGTGHFFEEAYWLWSDRLKAPKELQIEKADKEALVGFLPPKHGIWKGGHFDITTLSFNSYTWREGDGNCCPTGGKLSITYGIVNDNLVVKRAVFDYSDLEERALWEALRSEDSMYMKNPPIIYERD